VTRRIHEFTPLLAAKLNNLKNRKDIHLDRLVSKTADSAIEHMLKEEFDKDLKSYDLRTYIYEHFEGISIKFKRIETVEYYEITKLKKRVTLRKDRPKYVFAFPYMFSDGTSFYNTVARPQ